MVEQIIEGYDPIIGVDETGEYRGVNIGGRDYLLPTEVSDNSTRNNLPNMIYRITKDNYISKGAVTVVPEEDKATIKKVIEALETRRGWD